MNIFQQMQQDLDALETRDLLRCPTVIDSPCGAVMKIGGRDVSCFCSNDYLSLANHPKVCLAAGQAIEKWGFGSGASRLVSGTTACHVQLERKLAEFKRAPDAMVTSTGWMANRVAICALAGKGDLILCDKLNHASILDAAAASGATVRRYLHRDMNRLEVLLARHRKSAGRCLIVTDSVFSMDGDIAPLVDLVALKKQYDAQLLIDEAHATGLLGAGGRGAAELLGVEDDIDAVVGTLSKAIGSIGGFVAGPKPLINTIRNTGRAYIYTTAPPACACVAAGAALEIIENSPDVRDGLLARSAGLSKRLASAGLNVTEALTPIIPVIIGSAGRAADIAARLLEMDILLPAIRPPTVPAGSSRLRISLCASHSAEQIDTLVERLKEFAIVSG
ncbi:MAG: 8-amino-7-oxononanoate synthase [Phycisphaerales bacterium]|jgi:8-amino-7-oxononanoate synthase|nr:8-amino-7-oxononanoate synthase [Phycisphaerales bacterium]